MTVQDIANAVSLDMRQVLSAATPDINIIIPWIDRIHKDVLHTSLYNALIRKSQTITVTEDTAVYTLTDTNVRRITSVYDRTFDRILLPYEDIAFPTQKSDQSPGAESPIPKAMLDGSTMLQWPSYYLREGSNKVHLFPAPQKAIFGGTYEVYYETFVTTLTATTDTLIVPDDGKDIVVAGVNMLASQYLKNETDAGMWAQQYEAMKHGEFKG